MVRQFVRFAAVLLLGLALFIVVPSGIVAVRLCVRPLDVTTARERLERAVEQQIPSRSAPDQAFVAGAMQRVTQSDVPGSDALEELIDAAVHSDTVRYWFHAGLGRTLDLARCSAAASGLQWIKAAAHAHTPRQVTRASRGIARALDRAGDPAQTRATLCALAPPATLNPSQRQAAQGGGLACSPG